MKPRVLIVEDNHLLAADLAELVQQYLDAEPVHVASVKEALPMVTAEIALAFLDIEVLNGQSFPVARKLKDHNVPFVFISGNRPSSLPPDLEQVPFLPKPVTPMRLVSLAKTLSDAFQ